jgi:hypothetical protein
LNILWWQWWWWRRPILATDTSLNILLQQWWWKFLIITPKNVPVPIVFGNMKFGDIEKLRAGTSCNGSGGGGGGGA